MQIADPSLEYYSDYLLESCLKGKGNNVSHSRELILPGTRFPKETNTFSSLKEKEEMGELYVIKAIKYFAETYLKKLGTRDINKPLKQFFPEIFNETLTGKDLKYINDRSAEELLKLYKDRKIPSESIVYLGFGNDMGSEHFNSNMFYYYGSDLEEGETPYGYPNYRYTKRIYMNLPKTSPMTFNLALVFVQKCIDRAIPFDMKLFGSFTSDENKLDGTIFYSRNKYFAQHIEILEEILLEYPVFKQYIGSPIAAAGQVIDPVDNNVYFGVSHGGNNQYQRDKKGLSTYNDSVDHIINATYVKACCNFILDHFAYFCNKFSKEMIREISRIAKSTPSYTDIKFLLNNQSEIRKKVYEYLIKNKLDEDKNKKVLSNYIRKNFRLYSSLLNFGSLDYVYEPIYKDGEFLLFERTHRYNEGVGLK